jgi:hypothetical protein
MALAWAIGRIVELSHENTRLKEENTGFKKVWSHRLDPDMLGMTVRNTWLEWAKTQPNMDKTQLLSWEELSSEDKDIARKIGLAVVNVGINKIQEKLNQTDVLIKKLVAENVVLRTEMASALAEADDELEYIKACAEFDIADAATHYCPKHNDPADCKESE